MDRMLGPTGASLVGTAFLCFILVLGLSAAEPQSNLPDPLSSIREHNSDFTQHKIDSETGKLKVAGNTICFPWASRRVPSFESGRVEVMSRSPPTRDEIIMEGSQSEEKLQDLKAINAVKRRDLVYDESQSGDPDSHGLVNFMGVKVTGNGQNKKEWPGEGLGDNSLVDYMANSKMKDNKVDDKGDKGHPKQKGLGNYMNIDVSGVSVSAINTVDGGSAVATSNIIVKPVQVIVCPSEVEEKLK
jgi:hypothetical protein